MTSLSSICETLSLVYPRGIFGSLPRNSMIYIGLPRSHPNSFELYLFSYFRWHDGCCRREDWLDFGHVRYIDGLAYFIEARRSSSEGVSPNLSNHIRGDREVGHLCDLYQTTFPYFMLRMVDPVLQWIRRLDDLYLPQHRFDYLVRGAPIRYASKPIWRDFSWMGLGRKPWSMPVFGRRSLMSKRLL